ncbi:hypothetical protein FD755_019726 [Muntiacus reevesi]|uniref:Calponin n=1 Tax=Muntiacus reevesi TaxID=9886 RepID=A0A5N3X487_MUNRE|nr:hypothetical protein FD755_019726 [Muntiacus reevesi]
MIHFNKGPSYGLSAEAEEDLRSWIEEVTGMSIGTNFQLGLKDGIILCELANKLQPGSVKKVSESSINWPQLENIGLAKTKGFHTAIDTGDTYAEKQDVLMKENLKSWPKCNWFADRNQQIHSLAGMMVYGMRRHLYDPKMKVTRPFDQTTISLQMGTHKGGNQAGMLAPGTRRDIYNQKLTLQPTDNSTISLQMGTNKVASQKGVSVHGLGQQVYDPKSCAAPTEPVIHNGSHGPGPVDYQYGDQGIDY